MLGKASNTQIRFVDGNCISELERQINGYLEVNKTWEVIDIKYNMLTDPTCDNQLYITALIIYREVNTHE